VRVDANRWKVDLGQWRDGQQTECDRARERDAQRQQRRRDGTVDERFRDVHWTPTLAAVAATLCPLPPKGEQFAPRGRDACSRRGPPQRGDRRPMRVVTRGRLLLQRFSSQIQGGRGPAALTFIPPRLAL